MTTEERLEKMEHELSITNCRNRQLLAILVTTVIGIGLIWGLIATMSTTYAQEADIIQKVIRTNELILVDESGNIRAKLQAKKRVSGVNPELQLYDENGKERICLGIDELLGSGLYLYDKKGDIQSKLTVYNGGSILNVGNDIKKSFASLESSEGGSTLNLSDENKISRVCINTTKDGPMVRLADENDKVRLSMGVIKGMSALVLSDKNEKYKVSLLDDDGGSKLLMFDTNGKSRASLFLDKDGAAISLFDENQKCRATLGRTGLTTPEGKITVYPESSLMLFGPEGKVLWGAPQ